VWVYFRVDRPCYVTVVDYAPDGSVSIVYPTGWSGSNFVRPGRTYRIPESRRYSLRIAGSGGTETLVACAHEAPWPSGPHGAWMPPHPPNGSGWWGRGGGHTRHGGTVVIGDPRRDERRRPHGRVVVGGRDQGPGGRHDRVVVGPAWWPVPTAWYDHPERWSCDSVSFYVADRRGRGGPNDGPRHDTIIHERFKMSRCRDSFRRDIYFAGERAVLAIECVESEKHDPIEIVGRLTWEGGWESEILFVIDADGVYGERPMRGRTYVKREGPLLIEIEVLDYDMKGKGSKRPRRIDWIRFDVRVRGR